MTDRTFLRSVPQKVNEKKQKISGSSPRIISIASGKGGVGKTLTAINFALNASIMGFPVTIFDGDMGLSNVDIVMGLQAKYNIYNVLSDECTIEDVILEGPFGIKIIPSGSGLSELTQMTYLQKLKIMDSIEHYQPPCDYMIIDTGAGISSNVTHLNSIADDIIVVTTPEPHAMTDAYAFIKVMVEEFGRTRLNLLVNMVASDAEGLKIWRRIAEVSRRFLNIELRYLGSIPSDKEMQKFVLSRGSVNNNTTKTLSGQAWGRVAREIFVNHSHKTPIRERNDFWRKFLVSGAGRDVSLNA